MTRDATAQQQPHYYAEKIAEHRAKMEDLESKPKLAIMKEAAVAVRNQVIDMEESHSHSKIKVVEHDGLWILIVTCGTSIHGRALLWPPACRMIQTHFLGIVRVP
eukprot:scaffold3845_cov109-Skeletonema_marinoi.AAC.7